MPLIADLTVGSCSTGSAPLLILPPVDVEWVWFCHTLNPVSVVWLLRKYLETKRIKLCLGFTLLGIMGKRFNLLMLHVISCL